MLKIRAILSSIYFSLRVNLLQNGKAVTADDSIYTSTNFYTPERKSPTMRMRKKKNSVSRMLACADYKIENPEQFKGRWQQELCGDRELYLEIGCGKGTFITELAKRNPDKYYIAMEIIPDVIMLAMEKAKQSELENVKFVCFDADKIQDVFEDNELCGIYLNFSDPWPKNRHYKRRLTYAGFLEKYKKVLKKDGKIFFKTDNRPLFDFSLVQFMECGFSLSEVTTDLHGSMWEKDNIHTEYEDNFSAKGFKINRLVAGFDK